MGFRRVTLIDYVSVQSDAICDLFAAKIRNTITTDKTSDDLMPKVAAIRDVSNTTEGTNVMLRTPSTFAVVLTLAVGIGMADGPDDGLPKFNISCKRENDRVQVAVEKDTTVLVIQSPFGISEATVERTTGKWPAKLTLNLHLKGLEKFSISNGKSKLNVSVSTSAATKVRMWKDDKEDATLSSTDADWMPVVWIDGDTKAKDALQQSGYFSIRLPDSFFADNPQKIALNWIDFYRN